MLLIRAFKGKRIRFFVLVTAACLAGAHGPARAQSASTSIDIGQKAGLPPVTFDFLPTSQAGRGRWTVVQDATAATGFAIEQPGASTTPDRSLAVYKPAYLKNADVSLRLKAVGGSEDHGGGIAIRLTAPDTYYLVQLDARRDRALFSRVTNGLSEEIVGVDADIASDVWHTLSVRAMDDEFVVTLDGNWIFTGFDKTLSRAGRIALWTGTDSATRFDSMTIAPLLPLEQHW
jgi:hypothetical protein